MGMRFAVALCGFPLSLGTDFLTRQLEHLEQAAADLAQTRENIRQLRSRGALRGNPMGRRAQVQLGQLAAKERQLVLRISRAKQHNSGMRGLQLQRRLRLALVVSAFLIILMFWVSMSMSLLDQAFGSACGVRCGFHPTHRRVTTPLDFLLLATANLFPLDALLLAYLTVLVFGATVLQLHAHCGQASRAFCCVSSSHLRPRGSAASAIVLVAAHLLLAGFTLVTQLLIAAPEYALFGSQRHPISSAPALLCHNDIFGRAAQALASNRIPLSGATSGATDGGQACGMTYVARMWGTLAVRVPCFLPIWFFSNCLSVGAALVGTIVVGVRALVCAPSPSPGILEHGATCVSLVDVERFSLLAAPAAPETKCNVEIGVAIPLSAHTDTCIDRV
mmetsp:Transcript_24277/g.55235  ORF Transcript_24277/g.55235 Transcript_24277/m.55235 type:complete len:391 (-) Transcript_24277:358-1530(-)